jgi:DNA-binding transcriptional LysR family regulator
MSDSVEFRHLEYLLAIYEGKNFTRGAERVYRSQPAVSQQVRALEDDVGFPIFVRGGRDGVTPTAAGELVLNWARDVLAERREIFITARAIHNGEVPPLKLGFSPFVNPPLLQALRASYDELFPSCEIQLSSGSPMHTLQRLSHGGLDCAILPMPIDKDLWNVIRVAQSPPRVMGPTLVALTFAGVAHAQGTMDFSGAQTLMGTFQNFRDLRGCCHLFRRADLRRNPHDERTFSRCYPRTLRCAVRCRSARLGSRLDWLSDRAVDVGGAST